MAARKKTASKGRKSTRKASAKSADKDKAPTKAKAATKTAAKSATRSPASAKPRTKTAKAKASPSTRVRATAPARKKTPRAKAAKPAARPAAKAAPPNPDAALEALMEKIIRVTREDDVLAHLADLYHERCVSREVDGSISHGLDELRRKDQTWRAMVERSQFTPRRSLAKGDLIVIEWEGEILLRDGREFSTAEVAVHEIKDGKILKERYYYDPGPFAPQPEEPPPPPEPLPEVSPPRGTPPLDPLDL